MTQNSATPFDVSYQRFQKHMFSIFCCCKGEARLQGEQAAGEHQQNGAGSKRANAFAKY